MKAICSNLAKSKQKYLHSENYQELQQKTQKVDEKRFESLLEALIYFKSLPEGESKHYAQYRYLALDLAGAPCLTTAGDTLASGKQFVGPFRNLFFISDFTDKFAQLFDLPSQGEESACPKVLDYYLSPQCLENHWQEIEKMENRLEFSKAQELKENLEPLRRYFAYLEFIQASKELSFSCQWQGQKLVVTDGLLQSFGELRFRLNYIPMQYQPSERYAVPLDELDEREIVYNFFLTSGL